MVPPKALVLALLLYINDVSDDIICTMTIRTDDTTPWLKFIWTYDLSQRLQLVCELESDL